MRTNAENGVPINKRERPLGVWFLTFYAAVARGLFPIVLIMLVLSSSESMASEQFPTYMVVGNIAIGVSIIWSALVTWQGKDRGRIIFLILLSLSYGLIAYNNYLGLISSQLSDSMARAAVARIVRGFLTSAVYIWYFTRPSTLSFFERTKTANTDAI